MGWSESDLPAGDGRTALVTGANSGIGFHTARALAEHGWVVLLACRDESRGQAAADRIVAAGAGAVSVRRLDLADLASVRACADGVERLDLLVNNAGIMAVPHRRTVDGFESQMGTNHLGHFALTGLMLPALLAAPQARVVTVSSGAHHTGSVDPDRLLADPAGGDGYTRWGAYCASKLANLLFAAELERRARSAGTRVQSLAAHPGYAATNLQSRAAGGIPGGGAVTAVANWVLAQPARSGALPTLRAATDPDARGGEYYGPAHLRESRGAPVLVGRSSSASDEQLARRLWAVSETLTGVTYGPLDAAEPA